MKNIAIISFLWEKNLPILLAYLQRPPDNRPRTVIIMQCYATPKTLFQLEAAGANVLILEHMLGAEDARALLQTHQQLLTQLNQAFEAHTWATYCHKIGVPAHISQALSASLPNQLEQSLMLVTALNKLKLTHAVELIVLSEDVMYFSRTGILWGRQNGVASLQILHSPAIGLPLAGHNQIFADHMAVYGQQSADAYTHYPRERVHILGNHCWDLYRALRRQKTQIQTELRREYELNPAWPIVLFGTTAPAKLSAFHEQDVHPVTLDMVLQATQMLIQNNHPLNLVIKERPSNIAEENKHKLCQSMAADYGFEQQHLTYTQSDIERWITAADVLIACESSLAVEAMHVSTPTINLATELGMVRGSTFHAEDGIINAYHYDPKELAEKIVLLTTDKMCRAQHIKKMENHATFYNVTAFSGDAAANTATLMKKIRRKV